MKDRNVYLSEIRAMMHTFGDVKEPKKESVRLMRAILRDQMNLLLFEAEKAASVREGREISHEDILFVMRTSKMKVKRLMEYLHILDMKPGLNNLLSETEDFYDLKLKGKRYKMCLEFLALLQETDEFTSVLQDDSLIDIATLKRKMRRYWLTHMMETSEYQEFLKISQASFRPMKRFKDWLLHDRIIDLDVSNIALGMINFLARETIAEIIDMVLLMKMKKLGKNQHLQYEYFANSVHLHIKSGLNIETTKTSDKLNLETTEASDELSNGNKVNGDNSASTTTNKIHTTHEGDSGDQMSNMDANFKCFASEACREKNITPTKMNEDSNELNPDQSDHISHSSSRSQDDESLQLGENGCKFTFEKSDSRGGRTSGSDSNAEFRSDLSGCYETLDDSEEPFNKLALLVASNETESNSDLVEFGKTSVELYNKLDEASNEAESSSGPIEFGKTSEEPYSKLDEASNEAESNSDPIEFGKTSEEPYNKLDLNEASNEAESNSGPIQFGKSSEEVPSNHLLKYDMLSDVSDEHIEYFPESAQTDMSNMCPKIISELSNTPGNDRLFSIHDNSQNSLFNPAFSSERTFQGTPVPGASAQSQECLVDMSDTSDHEHFPFEVTKSCDHKKSHIRKSSPSNHSKQTPHQIEPLVDISSTTNLLSDVAKNEVMFLTPIEPVEIKEAYARFQETPPMIAMFTVELMPRKTKLICLAESLLLDV